MSIVTDFKSIAQILNRQTQKAEFEEKNPEPTMYWPYGVAVPFVAQSADADLYKAALECAHKIAYPVVWLNEDGRPAR